MNIINFENQSTLAKLLAKENITVTTGNMKTAYFDVKNRTLGLPAWKNRGKDVYDMLTGHEVGHALYTPADSVERLKERCGSIPFDVCNIVEDIRIERLIQETYPGLPRVFTKAYTTLTEDDFFGIKGKDVNSLKFLDRLNLRGKIGNLAEIPLNDEEESIYNKCVEAESFDDVLEICAEIKEFIENNPEPENFEENDPSDNDNAETDETPGAPDTESNNDNEGDESDDGTESHSQATDETDEEPEADTSSADVKSENDESETSNADTDLGESDNGEPEIPQDLLSDTLADFDRALEDEVEAPKDNNWTPLLAPRRKYIYDTIVDYKTLAKDREDNKILKGIGDLTEQQIVNYKEFKKVTNKKVGTLVREFEQRKAAYQYSRATQARTGKLDVNKLHAYKMTEEIFLSQTKLANAKSHGMIFLLDYSGSMSSVLGDVLAQTLNLVTFCKKVGVPFVVYSFTSRYGMRDGHKSKMEPTINEVDLRDVLLVEQISSDLSRADYETAFRDLWLKTERYSHRVSDYDELGGTPLNNVLTMMPTVINDFITKHKVQKLNFVTLTDGDSHGLQTNHEWGEQIGKYQVKLDGKHHAITYNCTDDLMEIIQDMTNVTTVGFFLPNSKNEVKRVIERRTRYNGYEYGGYRKEITKLRNEHKKVGFINLKAKGFDAYYLLDCDVRINDTDFTYESDGVDISSTKRAQTKLAREFGKHHSAARKNRVLLTNIASVIA